MKKQESAGNQLEIYESIDQAKKQPIFSTDSSRSHFEFREGMIEERSFSKAESRTQRFNFDSSVITRWNNFMESRPHNGISCDELVYIDTRKDKRKTLPPTGLKPTKGYFIS